MLGGRRRQDQSEVRLSKDERKCNSELAAGGRSFPIQVSAGLSSCFVVFLFSPYSVFSFLFLLLLRLLLCAAVLPPTPHLSLSLEDQQYCALQGGGGIMSIGRGETEGNRT